MIVSIESGKLENSQFNLKWHNSLVEKYTNRIYDQNYLSNYRTRALQATSLDDV